MFGEIGGKLLATYLKRYGFEKFDILSDSGNETRIMTGWASPGSGVPHVLVITVDRAKNAALFIVPNLAKAPREDLGPSDLAEILAALGFANYSLMLGKFSYDPSDGEIRFEYAMPIDNSKMSYEQFAHILKATTHTVEYWAKRIKDSCEGERSGDEIVESFMTHAREAGVV